MCVLIMHIKKMFMLILSLFKLDFLTFVTDHDRIGLWKNLGGNRGTMPKGTVSPAQNRLKVVWLEKH